jgi:hypothetical protein
VADKNIGSGFHPVRSFLRLFIPKKYRLLVMDKFSSVFLFFVMICIISTVFTVIFNMDLFSSVNVVLDTNVDSISKDMLDNSFLVETTLMMLSSSSVASFYAFILPSVFLYLFLYIFSKYLIIVTVFSVVYFIVSLILRYDITFGRIMKLNLYAITIMILFDILQISWYSLLKVPFVLYILLSVFAFYFVNSTTV